MNEVEKFINKFKYLASKEAEDLFLYGDCYYFSIILKERFSDAIIKYLMIDNHFLAEISGRLYDIRGDVTDIIEKNQMINWDALKEFDSLLYNRIVRDCIKF